MSIVEEGVKAAVSEMKKATFLRKSRLVNYISCIVIIFTFFNWKYWDVVKEFSLPVAPLLPEKIRQLNIIVLLVIWLVVWVVREVIRNTVIYELYNNYEENDILINYYFCEGIIDFFFSVVCLMYSLSMFVDYTHEIYPTDVFAFWIAALYIGGHYIKKQYNLFNCKFKKILK